MKFVPENFLLKKIKWKYIFERKIMSGILSAANINFCLKIKTFVRNVHAFYL